MKLAVPTFPASSVQLAVSVIVPSPLEVLWVVQLLGSIVERGSVQFQSTVTSLLFQPLAFAAGCATGFATGGAVSSNVIVIEPSPLCAPSVSVESVTLGSMWLDPPPPPPPLTGRTLGRAIRRAPAATAAEEAATTAAAGRLDRRLIGARAAVPASPSPPVDSVGPAARPSSSPLPPVPPLPPAVCPPAPPARRRGRPYRRRPESRCSRPGR